MTSDEDALFMTKRFVDLSEEMSSVFEVEMKKTNIIDQEFNPYDSDNMLLF